jgi:FMN-dependent NADH-azoreductase
MPLFYAGIHSGYSFQPNFHTLSTYSPTASGSDLAPLDFQEPYLNAIFNFIGITDIQFIHANGLNAGLQEQSLLEASEKLHSLSARW